MADSINNEVYGKANWREYFATQAIGGVPGTQEPAGRAEKPHNLSGRTRITADGHEEAVVPSRDFV